MTTMLEKAAWALSRLSSHGEMPDGVEIDIEDTYDFTVKARAVLQAIREVPEEISSVAIYDEYDWAARNFTAIIDAILNEETT